MTIAFFENSSGEQDPGSTSVETLRRLSDAEFVQTVRWRRKTKSSLQKAAAHGDVAKVARVLQKQIVQQTELSPVSDITAHLLSAWSLPSFDHSVGRLCPGQLVCPGFGFSFPSSQVAKGKDKKSRMKNSPAPAIDLSELNDWLSAARDREPLTEFEQLVLGDLLTFHSHSMPHDMFFSIWRLLLTAALNPFAGGAEIPSEDDAFPDRDLIRTGELPFRAGLLFRDIVNSGQLLKSGRRAINARLFESIDGDGIADASLTNRLALWIAGFVRCDAWATAFDKRLWDADNEQWLPKLLCQAVKLVTAEGGLLGCDCAMSAAMLDVGLELQDFRRKSPERSFLTKIVARNSKTKNGRGKKTRKQKKKNVTALSAAAMASAPAPSAFQSDDSALACLRNGLFVDADAMLVRHDQAWPDLEFFALGVPVFSGLWDAELTIDDEKISAPKNWECTCWQSDKDGDYFEFVATTNSDVNIERQIFLSRAEHFLLLTDAVSSPNDAVVELTTSFPALCGIDGEHDVRTREARLSGGDFSARVFPLALEQDRIQSVAGSFEVMPNALGDLRLVVQHTARGGIYSPLFIDWHPDRQSDDVCWRRLTVTEERRVVNRDEAAAFRLQVGSRQWFVYRSLKGEPGTLRCAIGHHTGYESVIGRFTERGLVNPLVLVSTDS